MSLTRGTYVIMNDFDRPEAKLVAVLTRYDDRPGRGIWHALYLASATHMAAPYGPQPTPLAAFGKRVEWSNDTFRCVDTGGPVTATYRDGRPRAWQDCYEGEQWAARKAARAFCAKLETTATETV